MMSQPLIHDLMEEGEDDISVLMMQVRRHQPSEMENELSMAPSSTSSLTIPSSPSVRSTSSSQRPYSPAVMSSMGAPKRRKKTTPPAEQAVSILQTLVEQKSKPPPPANVDTENDLFFGNACKKSGKASTSHTEHTQDENTFHSLQPFSSLALYHCAAKFFSLFLLID